MRVLVTGASGFVGRWVAEELSGHGHEVIPAPPRDAMDIADADAVRAFVVASRPDAVVHLAGLAFGPDATRDPAEAERVNATGTATVIESLAASGRTAAPLLVAGSADVYGAPAPDDLPLRESAPAWPRSAYGRSKLLQEQTALSTGRDRGVAVAVTRSFNHTGPGQRPEFVAPALARRILAARAEGRSDIVVGNIDVRRDFSDVRDVVRAYRLLLEGLAAGTVPAGTVVNVASGRSVSIREIIALLADLVGVAVEPRVDPTLVRVDDPPQLVGDISLLRTLTGWEPRIPLRHTLADLLASLG